MKKAPILNLLLLKRTDAADPVELDPDADFSPSARPKKCGKKAKELVYGTLPPTLYPHLTPTLN
jgi:hypothetical protein